MITILTLIFIPQTTHNFREHWWVWVVPALNALAVANIPRSLHRRRPLAAFVSSGATIAAFTLLFGVALYPNRIVSTLGPEHTMSIRSASSSERSLQNLLIVACLGLPFVISYTGVVYWVFRKPVQH